MPRWKSALSPGGGGSSDGSTPLAAGQPGSACGKGCRGGHDRRALSTRSRGSAARTSNPLSSLERLVLDLDLSQFSGRSNRRRRGASTRSLRGPFRKPWRKRAHPRPYCCRTRSRPWTPQLGGLRAYRGRLGKDRSLHEGRPSIASAPHRQRLSNIVHKTSRSAVIDRSRQSRRLSGFSCLRAASGSVDPAFGYASWFLGPPRSASRDG